MRMTDRAFANLLWPFLSLPSGGRSYLRDDGKVGIMTCSNCLSRRALVLHWSRRPDEWLMVIVRSRPSYRSLSSWNFVIVCDKQSASTSMARHIVQARPCFALCTCIRNCTDTSWSMEVIEWFATTQLFRWSWNVFWLIKWYYDADCYC